MRKLLAILQIFVLMAAMALPTAFAAEAPIMLAGLEAASSSSSTEAQHDWDTNLFFQTMQEKTGIAFSFTEYVSREAWTEAKTEMLAGEVAMPDMFFKAELTPQETLAFYEAGKLIDLRPYLAEYAPHVWALLEANPEWMEAVSLPDGAIVALPSINELTPNNTMWINKTWLDRLKMGVPTTAEELTEVLRQFRDRDMNQNGSRNDEIPLSFVSMWDLRFLAHAFGINADDYYLTEQNGKISEVLTTEENRAFLTWLHELYTEGLLDSQGFMAMRLVEELRQEVRRKHLKTGADALEALKGIIREMLRADGEMQLSGRPAVVLVIGVNGVGKTTSIAKLAHLYKQQGKRVMLAAGDTFRAAAAEQLCVWAERADVPVVKHNEGADPAAVLFDAVQSAAARGYDMVICDTAGRLHNKKNLMDELSKISRVVHKACGTASVETLLVLDAITGQNAISQASQFIDAAGATGIVLTKLDGTAKGGAVISIKAKLGLPVRFVGVGEGMDDLMEFDPDAFVDALFLREE